MKTSTREERLFRAAVALAADERAAFLDKECAEDPALRARLEALLAAHDQPDTLFGTEAGGARPTISLDLARELADDLVGETIGRYKLLEKLGEGGCGIVYVAEQTEPVRRRVALKIIKLGMDTKQVVARFEAERQALAMMDHPNIAKVLDAGTTDGGKSEIRKPKSEGNPKPETRNQESLGRPGPADAREAARATGSPLPSDGRGVGGEGVSPSPSPSRPFAQSPSRTPTGRPYFVMELVRGIRITDYCDQEQLGCPDRLDLFIKVCQAIQHAHQKGIILRDIKPSNILVTLHDGVPVPKVIDFGIAKAVEGRLTDATVYTQLHQFIGTPAYMSPEQAEMSGLDIDTRSDIYSLGVLLYELLTGTTPFDAKELMSQGIDAMRRTIREQEPVRPSTRLTELRQREQSQPPIANGQGRTSRATPGIRNQESGIRNQKSDIETDLDWIVMKCLEKDRGRRYETANGLAADLKLHLNNEPVVARPPSAAYRFQKAYRRNKLVFVAGTIVVATLVAGLGVSTWQWIVARRAEFEKRQLADAAFKERDRASAAERQARSAAYLADMRLVADSLQTGNIGRARRTLAEHRPNPGQADYRDWEWFYFEAQARADDSVEIGRHPGGARHLLTSQGNRFVTCGQTLPPVDSAGHIQVWDELRRRLLTGVAAPEDTSAVALSRDGRHLALARGLEIEIRPLEAPQSVLRRLTNWHSSTSYGHAHPHGLLGGKLACEINLLHFVNDDTTLVVARRSFTNEPDVPHPLTFIDIRTDAVLATAGGEPVQRVLSLALSADGRLLAADTGDTDIVIVRLPEREQVARLVVRAEPLPPDARGPMVFGALNRSLLTGSGGGRITSWDLATGQRIRTIGEHAPGVLGLAVSPDGGRLASFGVDHVIRVWDPGSGGEPLQILRGHSDEIWGGGFIAGGEFLLSCSRDQSVRSWDLRQPVVGNERWRVPPGHNYATLRFGVLAAVGSERRWRCWDVSGIGQTVEPLPVLPPPSFTGAAVIPVPGTDYRLVVPASDEPEAGKGLGIILYRGADQTGPVSGFPAIGLLSHQAIQHTPGTLLIHGLEQDGPKLLVWDVPGERVAQRVPTSIRQALAMAISPDQTSVFLGDRGGTIECVDLATGRTERWPGALPGTVSALAVLPDNRTVVAASRMGLLRKFDWPERRLMLEEVPGSVARFASLTLSLRGTRLVTGDTEGAVRLWDVETLREIAVLGQHTDAVGGVCFQADGHTLLSVDAHELRIWRRGRE